MSDQYDDEINGNLADDAEAEIDGNRVAAGDEPAPSAQAVLGFLAKSVVADPDGVAIDVEDGRRGGLSLNVHVSDGDMGRVIGKRGHVAQSIRTIVRAAAVNDGVSVDVEFVD